MSWSNDTLRLFLHVLAAAIWVGGQFVVGGAVPSLRRSHPDAVAVLARTFGRVAWPAYAVLVVTGMWSLGSVDLGATDTGYQVALFAKVLLAVASGAAAAVHQTATRRLGRAVGGAVASLSAVAALLVAVGLDAGL